MAGTSVERARRAAALRANPSRPPRDVTAQLLGPGPVSETREDGQLSMSEAPPGSVFEWGEGMFMDPESGVWWDRNEFAARDMNEALRVDARLKVLEFALGEPIRRATWRLKPQDGDTGEAERTEEQLRRKRWEGGMLTPIQQVLGQMTTAIYLRRSHHAKGLKLDPKYDDGSVMWSQLAFRPASTCRLLRDPKSGALTGFEQDIQDYSLTSRQYKDGMPIKFPLSKALIYVHGAHRDPVAGFSDLEVAYWCWKTKQKMIYLWMRYLEGVALPRTIVKHQGDDTRGMAMAKKLASMGSSGTAAVDGQNIELDVLDLSGKGPNAFTDGIRYFDLTAAVSVRATFVELGSSAAGSSAGARGSHGMYDSMVSDFMQGRESVATEVAEALTEQVVAPLVQHNFIRGKCPDFTFDPLEGVDEQPILDILKQVAAVPQTALPPEFVSEIIIEAARILQLDQDKIKSAVEAAQKQAEQAAAQAGQQPLGQQVAGVHGAISKIGQIAQSVTQQRQLTGATA